MFKTKISIKFRDADPAQIMFHGNILNLTHDVFEEFIQHAGFTWKEWFDGKLWTVPIRHVEVNYLIPLLPGKTYDVWTTVSNLGESSFKMNYKIRSESQLHSDVSIVHTFIDPKVGKKSPMPSIVREKLTPYLS